MADTVDTLDVFTGTRRIVKRFTNVSDATGESAVVKFDKSTLTNNNGVAPTRLNIEWIKWNVQGFTSVRVSWDATTDDEIAVLAGEGFMDYSCVGYLRDPASAGTTGDILFTTAGAAIGNTYDIMISVILSD